MSGQEQEAGRLGKGASAGKAGPGDWFSSWQQQLAGSGREGCSN